MKKLLALILALLLTTSPLAACGAPPQSTLSSSVSSSTDAPSSVTSHPVIAPSIASSSVSSSSLSSSQPASSESEAPPRRIAELIDETAEGKLYHYTFSTVQNLDNGNFIHEPCTFSILVPSSLYIKEGYIQKEAGGKLADIVDCYYFSDDELLVDIVKPSDPPSPFSLSSEYDTIILPDGRNLHYCITESSYDGHGFIFEYILDATDGTAIHVNFYIFSPPENYDYNSDRPMLESIMVSIQPF